MNYVKIFIKYALIRYGMIHGYSPVSNLLEMCVSQAERLSGKGEGLNRENLRKIKMSVFDWATLAYTEDQKDFANPNKSSFLAYTKAKL